jgi:UDP:flavonoid glycosyltransferase YjiC (YdhE family)
VKIGIQTWGSEGDVRPLLALAAGLRAAGHEVTLVVTHVSNKDYAALGASFGVPVRPAGRLDQDLVKHAAEVLAGRTGILRQVDLILRDLFEPVEPDMLREAKRLCRENDLVIGHFLVHPLRTAAELSGKSCVSVFLAPLIPSANIPPPGAPRLGRTINALLWRIGGIAMDRMFLPRINSMRRGEGLLPLKNIMQKVFLSPGLNLVASSPSLCQAPPDWNASIRQCGSFHLPSQGGQPRLTETLERFVAAGTPPVHMTIGSMSIADPSFAATTRLFTEAARLAGCRAIIQTEHPPAFTPADIMFSRDVEHDLLFPRCAAVVHHGGAGTSHAASRAGRPSIVIEHVTDQAFWGGVLHRAGIAPPMLHRRTVTAEKLARAITAVLGSTAMQARARAMGERMQRENGVARAIELIEQRHGS